MTYKNCQKLLCYNDINDAQVQIFGKQVYKKDDNLHNNEKYFASFMVLKIYLFLKTVEVNTLH